MTEGLNLPTKELQQRIAVALEALAGQSSSFVTIASAQTVTGQKTFSLNPKGANGQMFFPVPNLPEAHNCLYRGENLLGEGHFASLTDLSEAVQAGDFSDIFIGDYIDKNITVSGTAYTARWRVAGVNYFINVGDTVPGKNHLVLVPDTILGSAKMNSSNVTTGGFLGSAMWASTLPLYTAAIQSAFGSAHVLKHRRLLSSTMNADLASAAIPGYKGAVTWDGWTWTDTYACLMTNSMVYGCSGTASSARDEIDTTGQLPLFRIANSRICCRSHWWLSAVAGSTIFSSVYSIGNADAYGASYSLGVRPYFLFA